MLASSPASILNHICPRIGIPPIQIICEPLYLNPVPIHQIGERWIRKFERGKLTALSELKRQLEQRDE
jgi:hypothetical protein